MLGPLHCCAFALLARLLVIYHGVDSSAQQAGSLGGGAENAAQDGVLHKAFAALPDSPEKITATRLKALCGLVEKLPNALAKVGGPHDGQQMAPERVDVVVVQAGLQLVLEHACHAEGLQYDGRVGELSNGRKTARYESEVELQAADAHVLHKHLACVRFHARVHVLLDALGHCAGHQLFFLQNGKVVLEQLPHRIVEEGVHAHIGPPSNGSHEWEVLHTCVLV
mmetsp:Transcript_50488/g.126763  ORF Transcript_50488/g.126763 Transcript_50488/m.126763 type:complete len:224 (-) Transcript_50488:3446-4117(-)